MTFKFAVIATTALMMFAQPASAQALLGGVVGTGDGGGIVDLSGSGPLVNLESNGPVVNLPSNVSVPGVANVDLAATTEMTSGAISVLGGGGGSLNLPLGDILGGTSNVSIELPGVAMTDPDPANPNNPGTPGTPGRPGNPGLPGAPGQTGVNGTGGGNVVVVSRGGGVSGPTFNGSTSSRLRLMMQIMADRDWMKLARNNAICVPGAGVTRVNGWLPKGDWAQFRQVVGYYNTDIAMLQKMLGNCRSNREVMSKAEMKRVIGMDIRNGRPVLFTL